MSLPEQERARLYRYYDGEMSWLGASWFALRLRRSASLRAALADLEHLTRSVKRAAVDETAAEVPELWRGIEASLSEVDTEWATARERPPERARSPRADRLRVFGWPGLSAASAAAVLVAVLVLRFAGEGTPGPTLSAGPGVVRYLDSGGAPVVVIEDDEHAMTIVWMVDPL